MSSFGRSVLGNLNMLSRIKFLLQPLVTLLMRFTKKVSTSGQPFATEWLWQIHFGLARFLHIRKM